MKYFFVFGFLLLNFFSAGILGQICRPGKPYPLEYKGSSELAICDLEIPESQKAATIKSDGQSLLKPAQSGFLFDVSYNPQYAGSWDTIQDGTKIWRFAFHIQGASSMSLIFTPFSLNIGVRIFIYDSTQQYIAGAFSDLNNKSFNSLATSQIPGDFLIIEMQVPAFLDSYGEFGISGIGCDFNMKSGMETTDLGWFGTSGSCNVDINCTNDVLPQRIKNAVVRIVFLGHDRCTGTLVNTTQHNGANYILTAGHCFDKESTAHTAVFYFDYESPACHGPDGNTLRSVSGSTIRATGDNLDFTLVELLEPIPFEYKPYYAGWDITGHSLDSGFVIHHPYGDVKKISREDHSINISSYPGSYKSKTHFLVQHWESGVTEPGSSGAPLFDNQGRVTGTLTGGYADCLNPQTDYFQMFSHCWNDNSNSGNQLESWLDPVKRRKKYINGFDPYKEFWLTADTLSNLRNNESLAKIKDALSWGSYSGHNSSYTTGFAEKFANAREKVIAGVILNVADNYVAGPASALHIKVWNGTEIPQSTVYQKTVFLANLSSNELNYIAFDTTVKAGPTFFVGYELDYNLPMDTFSTFMAENRSISSLNTAYIFDDEWKSLETFTGNTVHSSYGIYPVVSDSIPDFVNEQPESGNDVMAYPNPASSYLQLVFDEIFAAPVHVTLFNIQGQTVFDEHFGSFQHIIPIELKGIPGGIYVISVKYGNLVKNLKIAIIK